VRFASLGGSLLLDAGLARLGKGESDGISEVVLSLFYQPERETGNRGCRFGFHCVKLPLENSHAKSMPKLEGVGMARGE